MPRKKDNKAPEYRINTSKLAKYVTKAQKGDKKALEYIVNTTSDYIYRYCLTLLCDDEEAREAVQDIYVIILQKLCTVRDADSFLKWLKVITANYCKNRLTRKKNYVSIDENTEFVESPEYDDRQIIPEECLETDEIREIIISAVNHLPDYQKECVLMHYYYQMNIRQTAAALNIKEGTVKSRLFNARKSIKAELEKYGINDNTFSGFSPLAYISYSLLKELENCKSDISSKKVIEAETNPQAESLIDSQSVLSSAVKTFSAPAAAKTALTAKAVAGIAAAGVIATGSIITYNVNQNMNAWQNNESVSAESTVFETQPEISMEELYSAYGFTETDRRQEIPFDSTAELNSDKTKDYIYDRMLNAIDYFDTLQATYYYSSENETYYSTYCIQQGANPKAKEIIYSSDGNISTYCVLDGKLMCEIYAETNAEGLTKTLDFDESICKRISAERSNALAKELSTGRFVSWNSWDTKQLRATDPISLVSSKSRIKYSEEDGENIIYTRNDCAGLPMSKVQYFSQSLAVDFLPDFKNWSIEKTGNILGRECFVISGKSAFIGICDFEMCVDKEIGALLSFNGYDINGDKICTLITDEFTVDKQISQSVFDDLAEYLGK